jgi:hypothetical protein
MRRLAWLACIAIFTPALATSVRAAEEENPFKKAKEGDFAKYSMTVNILGQKVEMESISTVAKKTDKEVTLETEVKAPPQFPVPKGKQKSTIDLTKPYDPTKQIAGAGPKPTVEKLKDGKEKIKVAGKEWDCEWQTYKMKMEQGGMTIEGEMKVWNAKDFAFGAVKMEMSMDIGGQKMTTTMELKEQGNEKK